MELYGNEVPLFPPNSPNNFSSSSDDKEDRMNDINEKSSATDAAQSETGSVFLKGSSFLGELGIELNFFCCSSFRSKQMIKKQLRLRKRKQKIVKMMGQAHLAPPPKVAAAQKAIPIYHLKVAQGQILPRVLQNPNIPIKVTYIRRKEAKKEGMAPLKNLV